MNLGFETAIGLPTGWHFVSPQGYRIPLKGELPSAKAVIDAIMQYRLENNVPVGDPQADMEAFVCSTYPTYCRPKNQVVPPPNAGPKGGNVDLIVAWANALYVQVGRLALVPQKEAEERAATCIRCPMQMDWASGCPPCVTSAQRLLSILRQGKDVSTGLSGTLKGCSCYGWDNRTAVHLDLSHLPPVNPASPDFCWVRQKS